MENNTLVKPPSPKRQKCNNTNIEVITRQDGIRQRVADGYVCATDMCKKFDKRFKDYSKNKTTATFRAELTHQLHQNEDVLVETTKGVLGETWVCFCKRGEFSPFKYSTHV